MKLVFFDFSGDPYRPGLTVLSDVVWNMAREFAQLGEDVHVVGPYKTDSYPARQVTVHTYPLPPMAYRNIGGHILNTLWGAAAIRKILPVDIIHCPEYLSTAILPFLFPRVPVVLTTPGNVFERIHSFGKPWDWPTRQVYKVVALLSARGCRMINTISHDMGYWWAYTGARPPRVVTIPYGVSLKVFRPLPRSEARKQVHMDLNSRVVLYVGRLHRIKGLDYLMEAMGKLCSADETVQLHIVGDGEYRARVEEMTGSLQLQGRVFLHGWVDQIELGPYYAAADVCVIPSISEPLGRVMFEAMACKTPIVASQVGGLKEHIVHLERGLLVPVHSVSELAEALALLLRDRTLASKLAENGYQYVTEQWQWHSVAKRIRQEVYKPALGTRAESVV